MHSARIKKGRPYDPVYLRFLLHVNALMVIEAIYGARHARLGFSLRQALDSIDIGLSLWYR